MIYLYWKNTLGAVYIAKGVHFLKVLQQLSKVINYLCQSLQKRLDRGMTGVVLQHQYDVLQHQYFWREITHMSFYFLPGLLQVRTIY